MKKFLFGIVIVCVAVSAKASYLAWQVNSTTDGIASYNMAALYATHDGDVTLLSYTQQLPTDGFTTSVTIDDSYSSFYVELYNYESSGNTATSVGRSNTFTYQEISNSLASSIQAAQNVVALTGMSYTATPEPTSGLLLLMGFAMLGLKRKKEV